MFLAHNFAPGDTEARLQGIGASTAGALLGFNKWESPVDVYLRYTRQVPSPDLSDNLKVQLGLELEPFCKRYYEKLTGNKVRSDGKTYWNKNVVVHGNPIMYAHPDFKHLKSPERVENKIAWDRTDWGIASDEIPESYVAQVFHQMACIPNCDTIFVWVLFLSNPVEFRIYQIAHDSEMIEMIEDRIKHFWTHNILENIPPAPICVEDVNKLYRFSSPGKSVEADQMVLTNLQMLREVKSKIKDLHEQKGQIEMIVRDFMQDAEVILNADGNRIGTWKSSEQTRFDTKRFKEDYPELYEQYVTKNNIRTLRLK